MDATARIPGAAAAVGRVALLHARVAFSARRLALPLMLCALGPAGGLAARLAGARPLRAFDVVTAWGFLLLYPGFCGLLLAGGAWGLEVEGRTLTYLLLRPVRRAHLYLGKLLAATALLAVLGVGGTVLTFLATWGTGGAAEIATGLPYLARAVAGAALAAVGFGALLGLGGVALGGRAFMAGAGWLLVMEWFVGTSPLALRNGALGPHLRAVAGVGDDAAAGGAGPLVSALVVLAIAAACTALGMVLAARREHPVPGGAT
jgi:hypothetical protein